MVSDKPTVAELKLHGGATIRCVIVEDPELDDAGMRVFWLEPVRPLAPGEQIASIFLDVLPARSKAQLRWPGNEARIGTVSWNDDRGRRHTRRQ